MSWSYRLPAVPFQLVEWANWPCKRKKDQKMLHKHPPGSLACLTDLLARSMIQKRTDSNLFLASNFLWCQLNKFIVLPSCRMNTSNLQSGSILVSLGEPFLWAWLQVRTSQTCETVLFSAFANLVHSFPLVQLVFFRPSYIQWQKFAYD